MATPISGRDGRICVMAFEPIIRYSPLSPEEEDSHREECLDSCKDLSQEELLRNREVCQKMIAEARIEIEVTDRLLAEKRGQSPHPTEGPPPFRKAITGEWLDEAEAGNGDVVSFYPVTDSGCTCPGSMHQRGCPVLDHRRRDDGSGSPQHRAEQAAKLQSLGLGEPGMRHADASRGEIRRRIYRCRKEDLASWILERTHRLVAMRESDDWCEFIFEHPSYAVVPPGGLIPKVYHDPEFNMWLDRPAHLLHRGEPVGMDIAGNIVAAITEIAEQPPPHRYNIGDRVERVVGGQVMTVELIFSDGRMRCRWTKPSGLVERADFEAADVKPVAVQDDDEGLRHE